MADVDASQDEAPPKKRRMMPLLIGLAGALVLGAGGFYVVWSGLIGGGGHAEPEHSAEALPAIDFVPLEVLTVNLPEGASAKYLRFAAQIEVEEQYREDVAHLQPRILDVLNGYLRAVDPATLNDPATLTRIRAQLLRRIQLVTGEGRVRDLLVTEFIVN